MTIQPLLGFFVVLVLCGAIAGLLILIYHLIFHEDEVVDALVIRRMERQWSKESAIQVGPDIEQVRKVG